MAIENGSAFLLKLAAGEPATFVTVAGMRTTQMAINGEAVNITTKDSGGWRDLLSGAGVRSVSVTAAGLFTGSAAETTLRAHALAGTIADCRLCFESGEQLAGQFLVTRLDYAGDYNGERNYTVALESSGPVAPVAAAAGGGQ